jgi:hypothetical protein
MDELMQKPASVWEKTGLMPAEPLEVPPIAGALIVRV